MGKVKRVDFLVIGAGMAGASAAANLSRFGTVALLEAEDQPGYHSTGRSAALFSEIYGNHVIRALTRASRSFLFLPPDGFSASPLVSPRETMFFGTPDQAEQIERFRDDGDVAAATVLLSAAQAFDKVPVFRQGYLGGAVLETGSADIDVDALHQAYLRQARSRGCELLTASRIDTLLRGKGHWTAATRHGDFSAPVVVNAAGAWGDEIAEAAGVVPVGLQPKRRTAVLIKSPVEGSIAGWPAAIAVDEQFYFKPDAGSLLISPADETDSPPCDAQPDELDVAIAVDRFEHLSGTQVRQISHRWAGLRVFSPDRTPVVGFDPDAEGFFWLVGQGGYGIQTAVALGRLTASLVVDGVTPPELEDLGLLASMMSPSRFRVTA